ncbi:MAG: PadR family transcriptional regulator [Leptolyngbyaceae cyanobacterium bins.302]|nr:PadR family transcriptional regulator [Leptolyngbyaceae cyanobacterium bins.302]
MDFEDIYNFFEELPPTYLNVEQSVCYVLSVLLQKESYGTELIQNLEREYPIFRISDPVLYAAVTFLENEQFISSFWKKLQGRGRPRRMLQLNPECRKQAQDLANLWNTFATGAIASRST